MFNEDLKILLTGKLDLTLGPLTSHSFRVGLPTMFGKAGFPDNDIQLTGRWTSTAFKAYVKTARPKWAALAASIWNTLTESRVPLQTWYVTLGHGLSQTDHENAYTAKPKRTALMASSRNALTESGVPL